MNSEQITAFLQEHWYLASVIIGVVILIGAIRNWNWLCDPTGKPDSHRYGRGSRRVIFFLLGVLLIVVSIWGFNKRSDPMTQEEQIRLYRLMEKLNWFFHQEMHYLDRETAEKTARECYPEIRDFTYDILWNDLPKEVQEQLMDEEESL